MKKQRPFKSYRGFREHGEAVVKVTTRHTDGTEITRPLDPRTDLWNHSPSGFEWGYGGSGPAQLALALLADHLQMPDGTLPAFAANRAVALHQEFKADVVGHLDSRGWSLTSDQIEARIRLMEAKIRIEAMEFKLSAEVAARV